MNSREFYNLCLATEDGINTSGPVSIQFLTDIAQNILLSVEAEQNTNFNAATGRLLLVPTQAGVFDYQAPDDCWRIAGILVESDTSDTLLDRNFYEDYGPMGYDRASNNILEPLKIAGINYFRIPYIRTFDAGDTANARYMFTEDPGTTTDVYMLWYYPRPTRLSSPTIPLSIPPPYDFEFLYPAVLEIYRGVQNGDVMGSVMKVRAIRDAYQLKLNEGEQGFDPESPARGF